MGLDSVIELSLMLQTLIRAATAPSEPVFNPPVRQLRRLSSYDAVLDMEGALPTSFGGALDTLSPALDAKQFR